MINRLIYYVSKPEGGEEGVRRALAKLEGEPEFSVDARLR